MGCFFRDFYFLFFKHFKLCSGWPGSCSDWIRNWPKIDSKLTCRKMGRARVLRVQAKHGPFFPVSISGHPNLTRPLFFPTRTREIHIIFESCHHVVTCTTSPTHWDLPELDEDHSGTYLCFKGISRRLTSFYTGGRSWKLFIGWTSQISLEVEKLRPSGLAHEQLGHAGEPKKRETISRRV